MYIYTYTYMYIYLPVYTHTYTHECNAQVQAILDAMPSSNIKPDDDATEDGNEEFKYRQTFMFSATMPPAVERITRKYLRRPAFVSIGEVGQTASTVQQNFVFCSETQKDSRLNELLSRETPPIMVFVNARKSCDVCVYNVYVFIYISICVHVSFRYV